MVANIKYYVVTIVSIFLAIGIGIFIGFMLNAQDILSSQREDIIGQLETKFDYLKEENENVKEESKVLKETNDRLDEFNRIVYSEMIKGKLEGLKIAIIETNDDYIYSEVNQTLQAAGAIVLSNTTIKDLLVSDTEKLKEIYINIKGKESSDIAKDVMNEFTESVISAELTPLISALNEQGFMDISGAYNEPLDYLIIGGGSSDKDDNRYKLIDKNIIEVAKRKNIPVIGIEKSDVTNSYVEKYKDSRISSIDNVESTIGKITLVLAMNGMPGNYGVKPSAESLAPLMTNSGQE